MRRLVAALGLCVLAACGDEGKITEVARYPSPAGGYDMVVAHMQAGQSDPFLVVMTKTGENPGKGARLLVADRTAAPPVVEWADGGHLTIRCDGARIWSFRNFWTTPDMRQANISVALECGRQGWNP